MTKGNMNQPEETLAPKSDDDLSVPWTVADTWLGLGLFVLIMAGLLAVVTIWQNKTFLQSLGLVIAEFLYLAPVVIILAMRHASWRALGFRKFATNNLALGCGLLVMAYLIIVVHNAILASVGVTTQGEAFYQLFGRLSDPVWLIFVGVVLAPLIEETFFRGFLFAGFRQRYGWNKAALLSSTFFALAHLELVALIPTFILGYLLAYLFHRSRSLWPGVILHFLVNSAGLSLIFVMSQMQK